MKGRVAEIAEKKFQNGKDYKVITIEFDSGKKWNYYITDDKILEGISAGDMVEFTPSTTNGGVSTIKSIRIMNPEETAEKVINYLDEMKRALKETAEMEQELREEYGQLNYDWTKIALSLFIARTRR